MIQRKKKVNEKNQKKKTGCRNRWNRNSIYNFSPDLFRGKKEPKREELQKCTQVKSM